ncbi:prevent-host-death family protein [Nocardiopsis mwathae]|uniref:Prevent-host-death family protein n=1 Tax=Nocardiopsis mwathae TaxID=1472723 RepID=A0A7X0D848_9ACTN|nr:prevent-host-death family protein [Nocardiopsis mwathae]
METQSPSPGESPREISQRDLRQRSAEIMDAVEQGQRFSVTRNGQHIGNLTPARQRRTYITRAEFAAIAKKIPDTEYGDLRGEIDQYIDSDPFYDPYDRAHRRGEFTEEEEAAG